VLTKELGVGVINGVTIAAVTAAGVYFRSSSQGLAIVIALAMVLSMTIASVSVTVGSGAHRDARGPAAVERLRLDARALLDGVFSEGDDGSVTFHEATHLTADDVLRLERSLQRRVLRLFQRRGLLTRAPAPEAQPRPPTPSPSRLRRSRSDFPAQAIPRRASGPNALAGKAMWRWGRGGGKRR
jgi:hypothetical protein